MPQLSNRARAVLVALLALIVGGGTVVVTTTSDDGSSPPAAITVHVDGLDAGAAPDSTITAPAATVNQIKPALEQDLESEAPAAAPAGELDNAAAAAAKIAVTVPALPTAGATQGFAGCRTSFVRNQSSRNGVRPNEQTLHYTVSRNVKGWADVNSVVALFDRASFAASSNFVIDAEGHCAYIVPIERKAWTQAAGNPFSVSYEIIAMGSEPVYLPAAGMARLRGVMREVSRRTGIPMRRGAVRSCSPTRSGIVEHGDWGSCGGGHTDIKPFSINAITASLVSGGVTATDKVTCRKINAWRHAGRPHGGQWERRTIVRRKALAKRRVTCLASGPVKV